MSCERCGGLKIVDHFYGTTAGTSAWSYEGLRCLNCGHITELPGVKGRMAQMPQSMQHMSERRWSNPSLRVKDRRIAEELFDTAV